jgi:GTP-binding protein LepA
MRQKAHKPLGLRLSLWISWVYLHMNIIQERLEREFDLNLISTAPSVSYIVKTKKGEELIVSNPSELTRSWEISNQSKSQLLTLSIHVPNEYVGPIIKLCQERRGIQKDLKYITKDRVQVMYDLTVE